MRDKGLLFACVAVLLIAAVILAGGIVYRTEYRETQVRKDVAPDGRHVLEVQMLGEPDWPFGPAHCRADLFAGENKVRELRLLVHADGAAASPGNFDVVWQAQGVEIRVTESEQPESWYWLDFEPAGE